jgi:precorrin-3B C17-methyltransferase / cobalt-factor III methyltransferase
VKGSLRVVGIGPGPEQWITPEASAALKDATDIVGYQTYLARVAVQRHQSVHGSDNGDELQRAQLALALAEKGSRVAVVSGGDPGVFAMAAAVFEAVESGPKAWRALDVKVVPGVTAMLAAAARVGAPLGNDFCAINLSDNLKPWTVVEERLCLAAKADFVIALYNPASIARPDQIHKAFDLLRRNRRGECIVIFAKAIGRADEEVIETTLQDADPAAADMRTLVIVGSSTTRRIERPGGTGWIYSPRRLEARP